MRRDLPKGLLRGLPLCCLALCCLPFMTGCLYHTRKLQTPKAPSVVMNADAAQLAESVNRAYEAVRSLSATVDLQASVGGARKGAITDYTSFRGYVLLRKPEMLRVLGLLPVVRTKAFDLVSDGTNFKLLIPSQNKVIQGLNSVTTKSPNALMNLRPNLFFDSMLVREIAPDDQVILTTDSTVSQDAKTKKWTEERDYLLSIVRAKEPAKGPNPVRELIPERVIRFNRFNLQPIEQDIYDKDGNIETQTLYGPLQTFGEVKFPGTVTIKRPLEEYQIVLTIQKLVLNQPLADNQFELAIPDGVAVKKVD
jgi:outer membrane lipoprotein-sorting protein